MRKILLMGLGIVLAGCQLIPIRTIGKVEEGPAEQVGMTLVPGQEVDVGLGYEYEEPFLVSPGEVVTFKNNQTKTVRISFTLDREIIQEVQPKGSFSYKYLYGGKRIEFKWDGGGAVVELRQ